MLPNVRFRKLPLAWVAGSLRTQQGAGHTVGTRHISWRRKSHDQGQSCGKYPHFWGRKGKEKQQQEVRTRETRGVKGEVREFAGEPEGGERVFSVSHAHWQMLEGHKVE